MNIGLATSLCTGRLKSNQHHIFLFRLKSEWSRKNFGDGKKILLLPRICQSGASAKRPMLQVDVAPLFCGSEKSRKIPTKFPLPKIKKNTDELLQECRENIS